jgi:hypothetical protein
MGNVSPSGRRAFTIKHINRCVIDGNRSPGKERRMVVYLAIINAVDLLGQLASLVG